MVLTPGSFVVSFDVSLTSHCSTDSISIELLAKQKRVKLAKQKRVEPAKMPALNHRAMELTCKGAEKTERQLRGR